MRALPKNENPKEIHNAEISYQKNIYFITKRIYKIKWTGFYSARNFYCYRQYMQSNTIKMYNAVYNIEYQKKIAYKIWNQNV